MQAYEQRGCPEERRIDPNVKPFMDLQKGDVFRHSGRILVKTSAIEIVDKFKRKDSYGNIHTRRFNALRLTKQPGSKSCISSDTMVEHLPKAAIYTLG